MKEPLNVVAWNMRPTANAMMGIQFGPGGNWNDTFWNSDRMGELLKDSLAETDPVKRHEMHCEMQKLVSTQSESSFLPTLTYWMPITVRCKDFRMCPWVSLVETAGPSTSGKKLKLRTLSKGCNVDKRSPHVRVRAPLF